MNTTEQDMEFKKMDSVTDAVYRCQACQVFWNKPGYVYIRVGVLEKGVERFGVAFSDPKPYLGKRINGDSIIVHVNEANHYDPS